MRLILPENKGIQFPVKVCYTMIINKAQGLPSKVAVHFKRGILSHVGCSNVRSKKLTCTVQTPKGKVT